MLILCTNQGVIMVNMTVFFIFMFVMKWVMSDGSYVKAKRKITTKSRISDDGRWRMNVGFFFC